jgi:hypothetical protein
MRRLKYAVQTPGPILTLVQEAEEAEDAEVDFPGKCNACKYVRLAKLTQKPNRRKYVPSSDNPREELSRLVLEHQALVKRAIAIQNMAMDKKNRETGDVIPTRLPQDIADLLIHTSEELSRAAKQIESSMLVNLRKVPIYEHFLQHVFGCGTIVSAYLVAKIDIHRSIKSSQLRRYCGLAVINGSLERPVAGRPLQCNRDLRTRLYQMFAAMRRNAAARSNRPAQTSKLLKVWDDYKTRMQHSERILDGNKYMRDGEIQKGAKGFVDSTGWHKAADVFIEDLYTVWRTLEGLEVWPSYYAAKLGYEHGGKISVNAPRRLTLEQALELVGPQEGMPLPNMDDRSSM